MNEAQRIEFLYIGFVVTEYSGADDFRTERYNEWTRAHMRKRSNMPMVCMQLSPQTHNFLCAAQTEQRRRAPRRTNTTRSLTHTSPQKCAARCGRCATSTNTVAQRHSYALSRHRPIRIHTASSRTCVQRNAARLPSIVFAVCWPCWLLRTKRFSRVFFFLAIVVRLLLVDFMLCACSLLFIWFLLRCLFGRKCVSLPAYASRCVAGGKRNALHACVLAEM